MRFCLGKLNFIIMGVAAVVILVGFVLMSGDPSTPDHFNPEVFSDTRVIYGPNLCFLGYLLMIVGICVPDKNAKRIHRLENPEGAIEASEQLAAESAAPAAAPASAEETAKPAEASSSNYKGIQIEYK